MVEMEVAFDYITNNFELRVPWERNFTRKHNVEDDTQGPDIDFLVVAQSKQYFRRSVEAALNICIHLLLLIATASKINKFNGTPTRVS